MTFDVLIQGQLRGHVELRKANSGKSYAAFRMTSTDKRGQSYPIYCVTFLNSVIERIRDLVDGDTLVISGEAAINTRDGPGGSSIPGLDVTVHVTTNMYHLALRRLDRQEAREALPNS
jgi:hypothetical protein